MVRRRWTSRCVTRSPRSGCGARWIWPVSRPTVESWPRSRSRPTSSCAGELGGGRARHRAGARGRATAGRSRAASDRCWRRLEYRDRGRLGVRAAGEIHWGGATLLGADAVRARAPRAAREGWSWAAIFASARRSRLRNGRVGALAAGGNVSLLFRVAGNHRGIGRRRRRCFGRVAPVSRRTRLGRASGQLRQPAAGRAVARDWTTRARAVGARRRRAEPRPDACPGSPPRTRRRRRSIGERGPRVRRDARIGGAVTRKRVAPRRAGVVDGDHRFSLHEQRPGAPPRPGEVQSCCRRARYGWPPAWDARVRGPGRRSSPCWGSDGDGQLGVLPGGAGTAQAPVTVARHVAGPGGRNPPQLRDRRRWRGVVLGRERHGPARRRGSRCASSSPRPVALPAEVLDLRSGFEFTCALLADASLWCWGYNWEGQLGLGDTHPGNDRLGPCSWARRDWVFIATGQGHGCGIRAPGDLYCWGRDTKGSSVRGPPATIERRSRSALTPTGSKSTAANP